MRCLSLTGLQRTLEGALSEAVNVLFPSLKNPHQPCCLGSERGASAGLASPARHQHRTAQHFLHPAKPVEAGAIAPADRLSALPDSPFLIDSRQEADIVRAHQEETIPFEPEFVAGSQVLLEG